MILMKGLFVVTDMINKKINKGVHFFIFLFGEFGVDSCRQSLSDHNMCQTMNLLANLFFVLKLLMLFCFGVGRF